ncbi:MAG: sugar ABC transporter substrate-binding protein, partial [Streptosporangiales bacterium]|nr:sugar ABC transporter substrate-binding protein [Streptosporangiales bacterium]
MGNSSQLSRRSFLTRTAGAGLALGAGPTLLTACGGSSSSSGPLTFWNFYAPAKVAGGSVPASQSKWFDDLIATWNKSHKPQIKLQYIADYLNGSKLQTAFAAGKGPDIFLISPGDFLRYYNGGVLEDLTPHVTKEAQQDFFPNVMKTRTVDGKIHALPMEVEPMAFFYSVKAFEGAGLSEADVPKTWDDLLNVAHKLRTKKRFGVTFETTPGYYQDFTWYPFMWEGGADVVGPDGKTSAFDAKGTVDALRLWQESIKSGVAPRKFLGTGGNDILANLATGYTAIQNCGIWSISALKSKPRFEYGMFKLPTPPGGRYTTVLGGWAFVANAKGKDPEAAAKFCAWALGSMSDDSVRRVADWCVKAKSDIAPRKSSTDLATKEGGYSSAPMKF